MNMNKCKLLLFVIFPLLLALGIGCGAQSTVSARPSQGKLSNYEALEVADFQTKISDVPEEVILGIPDRVVRELAVAGRTFSEVRRVRIENIPPEKVLTLVGVVTEYESGGGLSTSEGALKWGEGTLKVRIGLIDKSTEALVAQANIESRTSSAFTKGGMEKVYDKVVEEIVKFISKSY